MNQNAPSTRTRRTPPSRRSVLFHSIFVYLVLCALLRVVLLLRELHQVDLFPPSLLGIFLLGVWFDLATVAWLGLPAGIYLWLVPDRWRASLVGRLLGSLGLFLFFYTVVFSLAAEWFFWEEFSVRFNFIAVDYLVYTTEVIGNIRESYPLPILLTGVGVVAALLAWLTPGLKLGPITRWTSKETSEGASISTRIPHRTAWALVGVVLIASMGRLSNGDQRQYSGNNYNNELAGNGVFQLFSAYINNELDYESFYATIEPSQVDERLRTLVGTEGERDRGPTWRDRPTAVQESRKNVVFIVVESLSGYYMGIFGNPSGVTPNLDALADQGIFFERLYATGTRTVRGLEALSLSIPPTPGQSIVRRPDHSDLFTLGTPFQRRGYDVSFLYGGYGYFDNMNAYFADNGFQTIDRTDMDEDEIGFANIWGVSDEYLFDRALVEADRSVDAGKKFFQLVLTTSNHRPFTYPDGRVDIPSPGGREGAIKYTDWSIARFLDQAKQRDWFEDTVFVIVADHCHASAGKTDLPIHRYHIPGWIYAPGFVEPERVEALTSQIDLAPTLLAILGFDEPTPFFGIDALSEEHPERVFISTYQLLGLVDRDQFAILQPGRLTESFRVLDFDAGEVEPHPNESVIEDAITYYQGASYVYHNHLLSASIDSVGTGASK